jgi:N-acyl amino acid synthase of PEP-CTERM/exosortase system
LAQAAANLSEKFLEYFDIAYAVSAEQKAEVYGIRYSVYCDEFAYEPTDSFPDHEETDEFDAESLHALVTHKSSGLRAGCVRLVSPSLSADSELLPFEKHCMESLDQEFIRNLQLDRNTVCEISRLAVEATFRRRPGERLTRFGEIDALDCTQQERRTFSSIAVACFLAATAMIDLTGRINVFAMMEPFLPRLLKRSGLAFSRAGTDIDYHGVRAPYFINTPQDMISPDLRDFYSEIHRCIKRDYPG